MAAYESSISASPKSPPPADNDKTALTDAGTTIGTIAYMSPEQARGNPDLTPQSDQFSFGLILYELASGKRAFQRDSAAEIMTAIIREDAEPLPATVPAQFRWIVERLLAKEPADRYDSTRDLYRDLRQLRDRLSESTSVSGIQPASSTRTFPKQSRATDTPAIAAGFDHCRDRRAGRNRRMAASPGRRHERATSSRP